MRRYLLLILCLSFALSSLRGQSSVLPNKANDDISVIVNDSLMFIGQNVDSLTEEQRYFNPLYLIVQKGKEYLKKQLIRASVCDCDTTVPNRRIGIFSVAPNKHVSFSQGNLQYFPAANLWKFADNQYEYLGASNKYLSPTYRNWVDLFGWSGDSGKAPFGVSTSTNHADYAGEFLDWGTNSICGDAANIWRTLSKDEWDYLLNDRKNATSLIGIANINGINGLVILPDSWTCPAGVTFKSGFHSSCGVDYYAAYQTFTADQWSKLEKSGAIFLPAAGYRRGSDVYDVQNYGSYWATEYNGYQANDLDFLSCVARMDTTSRYCGQSVRLVHDTIVPTPAPCETFEVNGVSFNMMCVEGGTFMMGQTEVTQALWKVVMGTTPENEYNSSTSGDALMQVGDNLPMAYLSWNDAQKFVERLNAMTGLYFRLPTEAEWIYAAKGGQRSKGYKYSGSDSLEEVAWCATNAKGEIKPVGLLKPNELGIYDMCGNVWEFCNDVQSDGKIVAHGCSSSESWSAAHYRPEYRYLLAKTYKANRLGLRLVMDTAKYIPTPCETFEVNGVKFNMMCVEGGTFMMGTGSAAHQVTLSDYKIAQTELTQGLWEAVMGSDYNTILSKNNADIICLGPTHPAYALTWIDCQEFVNKLNQLTGLNFRMSTEAEWEFAARGGNRSRGYTYAGSNDLDAVAWHGLNSDNLVHPVAQKLPNELGIYDMAGNAWELCLDGYAAYATYSQTNPIIPVKGDVVARGGSSYNGWSDDIWLPTHRLNRSLVAPRTRNTLRLVLSDEVTVKTVVIDNNLTFNMIGVNSGTFMMGQTEVTQALWKAVMGTTLENEYNSSTSGDPLLQVGDNLPMAYLSWNDAQKFVERLNAMTGLYFRLPTEAEWIYAAKGGQLSKGYKFAGSDILEEVAWCGTNANGAIKQVGLLKPNELGIYDMSGNVWEYCSDVLGTGEIFSHGGSSYPGWNETYSDLEYRNIRSKANKAGRLGLRLVMDTAKYIPTPCKTFEVNGVKFNMMCVEGGTMTIGAGDIMEYRRRPEHKTTISDFYIGQTQVTQELWQAVMGDNPSVFKSDTSSSHPVENVSVIDIQEFLTKLNAMTGVNFRLPTEAEWEYAARGGQKSKGFMYAGSDDRNQVAWYGVSDKNGGTTHPVAQKRPNELGLYDMHGNVWEWLHDRYADTINIYPSVNPTGFISNLKASPVACGSAYYSDLGPSNAWGWVGVGSISTRSSWFGFRLALSDEDPFMAIDVNNYRFHMMLVKGGTFQMGAASTDTTALENERPAHQVTLPDYYAGQTEVTRALWKTVMGSLPDGGEADNKPITNVNYDECQTFITQLNDLTGRHFRLPTEAEWEFAARGGNQSKGYKYAGSNDVDSVAWWQETSGDTIHPVAQLMPNELGIYDMSGNVFEWCSDWYGNYASNAQINPQGAASGTQRVGRGGGYRAEDNRCRVTRRIPTDPEQRMTTLGLRLVLDKHAYVDLGLSVLWATTNLGATQPEEYGDYFAWGETEPKDSYTRDNYKWRDNTKYNNSGGLTSIQLEDDAAHVNWGGEWRMPTKEEYSELIEKCTWTWTQHKGINGYQVTGPNGNSIFLPATGYIGNGPSYPAGEYGLYWTTELKSSSINSSYILIFGKNYTQRPSPNGSRFYGFSIRPVCPPPSI